MSTKPIYYSEKYYDDKFEYRHVVLPKEMVAQIPKNRLMSEKEWRSIGVQQSPGWIHYMSHSPGINKAQLETSSVSEEILRKLTGETLNHILMTLSAPEDFKTLIDMDCGSLRV